MTKTLAIDIAKENFYIFGVGEDNEITIDKPIGRKKLMGYLANQKPMTVYMEACAGSNYLCKQINKMGHKSFRIAAQHVKPYVGRQKNDRRDAMAILEASRRPGAIFVQLKEDWQQDLQSLHKIRELKVKQYKSLVNQVRGLLFEYGILISKSVSKFEKEVPKILEDAENQLSLVIRTHISDLFKEVRKLKGEAEGLLDQICTLSSKSQFFTQVQEELVGVGPVSASKFLSQIGHHSNYKNGRQVAASLGLVPRQHSSGGKTVLGRITKTGDSSMRSTLVMGARSTLARLSKKIELSAEEMKLKKELENKGFNKLSIQLANRSARQMWAIMRATA